jgi:hypothetical protein
VPIVSWRKRLRKILLGLTLFVSSSLFAGLAHAQGAVQIFLGYSYLRPAITDQATTNCSPGPSCPGAIIQTFHPNLNGVEASVTLNPKTIFGITADFSENIGSIESSTVHLRNYLFGPQFHFPGAISPFFRALVGAQTEAIGMDGAAFTTSGRALALAAGGGLDLKMTPYVSFRAIQIDYLRTEFSEYGIDRENQFRVSAGIVIHF